MNIAVIAFSERGEELAERVCKGLEDCATSYSRGFGEGAAPLTAWAKQAFARADALLVVGSCEAALRAVASYVRSAEKDPALVVVDEGGAWAIPLLAGRDGAGNRLARRIATLLDARAVLTSSSASHGVWAVDEWADLRGLAMSNPGRVKMISGALARGRSVVLRCGADVELVKPLPNRVEQIDGPGYVDVAIAWEGRVPAGALHVVPRCLVAGVSCRVGAPASDVEAALRAVMEAAGADERALMALACLDDRADEPGVQEVAEERGLEVLRYSKEQLQAVESEELSASSFVGNAGSVVNVCERAALAEGGRLLVPKAVCGQVTAALAVRPQRLDFAD